jgi:hypothetical protein
MYDINPVSAELILPTVRTRQCRVPTINRAIVTSFDGADDYFEVGKRHCRVPTGIGINYDRIACFCLPA